MYVYTNITKIKKVFEKNKRKKAATKKKEVKRLKNIKIAISDYISG